MRSSGEILMHYKYRNHQVANWTYTDCGINVCKTGNKEYEL